jgi:DNA helicase-2/ATP-dependent DNA helicase PcrA
MSNIKPVDDNHIDDHVDDEISNCLNMDNPKSFFLFAGAGSGKTRSLVRTLSKFRKKNGNHLRLHGQRVAIITYTNAACDEIKRRLDYDPLFSVSTIHSFVWDLINSFQIDIRKWLKQNLSIQIEELQSQQQTGRAGTKTAMDREKSIESKNKRIQNIEKIKRFTYNPNGDNLSKDSLNHAEVINLGAYFLKNKLLMQKMLTRKFPILLIDESQDTNKELMNAFLEVQKKQTMEFVLGLFGDTMQRIYSDGKVDLGINLPEDWAKPVKLMNHRCPNRIIKLLNKIRSTVDKQAQKSRSDKQEGIVRLFIFPSDTDKESAENKAAERMAEITNDLLWSRAKADYKALILEHHMAARRMGFLDLFESLYQIDKLKTGLLDGSLAGLRFFRELVLPIIRAKERGDQFAVTRIVTNHSPLLSKKIMRATDNSQLIHIKSARDAVNQLLSLWEDSKEPRSMDVLQCIAKTKLFDIPDSLYPIAFRNYEEQNVSEDTDEVDQSYKGREELELEAWDQCLSAPFSQIQAYDSYVTGQSNFGTHQGVKGLEFPRVMVIIDDNECRGFLFSYEKLFGAKGKTVADLKNEQEGKDTSIDRTRRLFYVTCSRAEKSLAIIAYSAEPEMVRKHVLAEEWFEEREIEIII